MTRYPVDNFYHGYSLSVDLNRSGKEEYRVAEQRLKSLGITPTSSLIQSSLKTIQHINNLLQNNGRVEQERIIKYYKSSRITAGVIPFDISSSYDVFKYVMGVAEPFVIAGSIAGFGLGVIKKIINGIKKHKPKDPLEKRIKQLAEKLIKKDTDNLIIKNILVISVKGKKNKKIKAKSKKTRSISTRSKKIRKRK